MALLKIGSLNLAPDNLTEYSVKAQDIDGPNTGRGETGKLVRDRVRAGVVSLSAKWEMLATADKNAIISAVSPAKFTLQYSKPSLASLTSGQFYASIEDESITSACDGGYWELSISFVEY